MFVRAVRCFLCAVLVLVFPDAACEWPTLCRMAAARTLTADELVHIGEIHDAQNHYPEALTYYEQALDAYRTRKQRKGEAIVLTKMALVFERQGRRHEAALQLSRALSLFPKHPTSSVHADALYADGRILQWLGSREDAARRFEEAEEAYRRLHNEQSLGAVMIESGLLKVSDAGSEKGLHEIEQVLEAARARRDDEQTLLALMALGDADWLLGQTEAAGAYYEQALALTMQRPHPATEGRLRIRLAALRGAAGRQEEGIELGKRAVTLRQSLRDASGEAASWALLAWLYESVGKRDEAEEALAKSLGMYGHLTLTVHAIRSSAPAANAPGEFR